MRSLPATAALTAILAAAREARTPAGLRALLGGPDASTDGVVRADAVVAQLVRLGLLEVHPDLPDQGLTASTLSAWLDQQVPGQVRSERLAGLLDDLRAIRDQIDAARSAAPTEHRGIAAILHARTADAARRLGLLAPAEEPERGTGYFHHTVVTGTAATLDREAWRPALADLALVPGLLAPFDTLGPRRAALQQRAVTLHGPGFRRPLTAFLQDFGSWWAEATTATPTERDARRQAALRGLIADTPEDADGTVRLSPQAVRALCGDWPDPHTAGDRHACYVQALPGTPAGLGLVLNTVTCGHGTGRTRIARLLGSTLGGTSDTAGSIGTTGTTDATSDATFDVPQDADAPLYAEFDAAFGSALNQRVPATPDAIDLDGSHPDRPAGHLLRPADLEVVHDRQAQRLHLVHRDTGRVVRPLHLGLLATPCCRCPPGSWWRPSGRPPTPSGRTGRSCGRATRRRRYRNRRRTRPRPRVWSGGWPGSPSGRWCCAGRAGSRTAARHPPAPPGSRTRGTWSGSTRGARRTVCRCAASCGPSPRGPPRGSRARRCTTRTASPCTSTSPTPTCCASSNTRRPPDGRCCSPRPSPNSATPPRTGTAGATRPSS